MQVNDRALDHNEILTPKQLAERLQVGVNWVYEKSRTEGGTAASRCQFSALDGISASTGPMFATGSEPNSLEGENG